ncbi:MAG: hypothetical protein HYR86_15865, partial [Candidatus Rokubacteria bacterium]|nr:hypothetical protein [Candidatus Rokubacteria bacterium]
MKRRQVFAVVVAVALGSLGSLAEAAKTEPAPNRAMVVVSFDTRTLPREEAWIGDGVAELLTLAFVQHPAFVQIDRARLKPYADPKGWGDGTA